MKRDTNKQARSMPLQAGAMNDLRVGAAQTRLANCRGQADAIEAVREIVSNFLGSEEMALFDFRSSKAKTLWSFGSHTEKCNLQDSLGEKALQCMLRGECEIEHLGDDNGRAAKKVQAFVPLRVGSQTVGVLAILQLLPQKASFDAGDMELLQFISNEAGKALFDSQF